MPFSSCWAQGSVLGSRRPAKVGHSQGRRKRPPPSPLYSPETGADPHRPVPTRARHEKPKQRMGRNAERKSPTRANRHRPARHTGLARGGLLQRKSFPSGPLAHGPVSSSHLSCFTRFVTTDDTSVVCTYFIHSFIHSLIHSFSLFRRFR